MLLASVPAFAISGTGTESNPYLISSASDIAKIHYDLDGYYKLTNDINMSGVDFEPIGNEIDGAFTGTIDGNGYSIKNLTINLLEEKYVGLIGYLEGTVKNINLVNVNANGYRYVGAISGYNGKDGNISFCNVTGKISGEYIIIGTRIGGITGHNDGIVSDCISDSSIICNTFTLNDKYNIGGITGFNDGTVVDCINDSSITCASNISISGTTYRVGGITGFNTWRLQLR